MALLQGNQGQTGKQTGQNLTAGFGEYSDLLVTELMPRYYEQAYRGALFMAALQAAVAVTNLATTATGFILSNPAGSGKNIVLIDLLFAQLSVAGATQPVVALAANVNPIAVATVHTTPLTIQPGLLGGAAASIAKADSAATLPAAPVIVRVLWGQQNTATATGGPLPFIKDEIAGAVMISPGCTVSLTATAAVSGLASMTWAEVPV